MCFRRAAVRGTRFRLSYRNGAWEAFCTGNVLHNGKLVQNAALQNGDMLVLNPEIHLAVQLVERGEEPEAEISLTGLEELLIGRASNCALRLGHPRVSGSHAKLYRSSGQWRICDINSTNGEPSWKESGFRNVF